MLRRLLFGLAGLVLGLGYISHIEAQERPGQTIDTIKTESPRYDPFGPEESPDHEGRGSGGVMTPSPHENITQTYFTRMNSDYYGVQYMLDSPLQVSAGGGWSAYQIHDFGVLLKARVAGIRKTNYDPIREEDAPYYLFSSEASTEFSPSENRFRAFKFRLHILSETKGLSMAGMGVLMSKWNLSVAGDRPMDRKLEAEATWVHLAGGYLMPLSPKRGGVNAALCGAVDLLGLKYQSFYSGRGKFFGSKIGSIGWLAGVGWNASTLVNLSGYTGGEWSFSTGGLKLPTDKIARADITRNTLYLGLQATGRWFNLTGGIQKEWEYLDYHKNVSSEKGLRYYAGISAYMQR